MLGPLIDTVIGMVLLFAILGVVNTVLVEAVARFPKIAGNKGSRDAVLRGTLVGLLGGGAERDLPAGFAGRLLGHPLVLSLSQDRGGRGPSYISARVFSTALMDLLDAQGSALPARLSTVGVARFRTLVDDLEAAASRPGLPDALARLVPPLRRLAAAIAAEGDPSATDLAAPLFAANVAWPRVVDLVRDPDRPDNLDDVVALLTTALPESWRPVFAPVEQRFRAAFELKDGEPIDAAALRAQAGPAVVARLRSFAAQVDAWETTCTTGARRGLARSLAGIGALIEDLPPSASSLQVRLRAMHQRIELETDAATDAVAKFYAELEDWYTEASDRAGGLYKRQARKIGFCAALLLCGAIDADALFVLQTLSSDPNARTKAAAQGLALAQAQDAQRPRSELARSADAASAVDGAASQVAALKQSLVGTDCGALYAQADQLAKGGQPLSADRSRALLDCPARSLDSAIESLQGAALPVGWVPRRAVQVFGDWSGATRATFAALLLRTLLSAALWKWLIGILISALAATMGGEYWFKVLDDVVRLAGPKPQAKGDAGAAQKPA